MTKIQYQTIKFALSIQNTEEIQATFMNIFTFSIPKKELLKISKFQIKNEYIEFEDNNEKRIQRKFNQILTKGFEELKSKITGKKTIYIHQNSGIPLIGSNSFGIVDRGTNIIEIKPLTGCNLNCIYCSVDSSKRDIDFVVEPEYIIEEFRKLVEYKTKNTKTEKQESKTELMIEAHIGGQAEPLLYSEIITLIKGLSSIPEIKTISIDTNGTLLTKERIDSLINAGLTRFNLSLNSLDETNSKKISGKEFYDSSKIKEMIEYIPEKADLIIAPVWVPSINDADIEEIIKFTKELLIKHEKKENKKHSIKLGIQNFLKYKGGRNPTKEKPMETFYSELKEFEKKYSINLILKEKDFNITKTKTLPKPFKKGDRIKTEIKCKGRFSNEYIGVAGGVTFGRAVTIISSKELKGTVNVRITRDKHNIYYGEVWNHYREFWIYVGEIQIYDE